MYLTDRVLKAWTGTMIPLRMFMAVQMMIYGIAYFVVPPIPGGFYESLVDVPHGWLWIFGMGSAGLWMMTSALVEGWLRVENANTPWARFPLYLRLISNSRFASYFFTGCLWFGVTFNLWMSAVYQITSLIGPVFIVFISWAAVNDATQRRKRLATSHRAFLYSE